VYRYLQEEEPEKKAVIARNLGIPEHSQKMPVILYIEIASRLQEDRWRLVNRTVERGMVHIRSDEIDEILRERLRVIMYQNLPHNIPSALCLVFRPYIEKLQQIYQQRMLEEFGSVEESAFPPCMQAIINALIQSASLPHMGRFAITAFLHNIGMDNTRIIELYGHVPNFDLGKTMYQVEHISGRGGIGTEYLSPLCSTMKTYALCIHPDALCNKITHPLTYYKQKKKMVKKTTSSGRNIPDEVAAGADESDKKQERYQV
jgi:DNA primase large subunit